MVRANGARGRCSLLLGNLTWQHVNILNTTFTLSHLDTNILGVIILHRHIAISALSTTTFLWVRRSDQG